MRIKIIICAILSLLALALGIYKGVLSVKYNSEKDQVFSIRNKEDFYTYLEYYESFEVAYLENNIVLTEGFESIGSKTREFNKVFDGKGYSISLKDDAKNIPLFNIIDKNGVVKNLEINVEKNFVKTASYAPLALCNKGKIYNINLNADEISVDCDSMVGAMVCINDGEINNCHIKSTIKYNITDSRKSSIVSGLCAYNNGTIKTVISNVTFNGFVGTNHNNIINGTLNESIGAIYGINNGNLDVVDNYYLSAEKYYLADNKYVFEMYDLGYELTETMLLNTLHFNNKIWKFSRYGSNSYVYNISLEDGVSV